MQENLIDVKGAICLRYCRKDRLCRWRCLEGDCQCFNRLREFVCCGELTVYFVNNVSLTPANHHQ